jgi:DNA-binding transcriptional LysR family regulator
LSPADDPVVFLGRGRAGLEGDGHHLELYASFRSEREEWVQGMVQAGLGFAFMPEFSVTLPGVLARPLIDPAVERSVIAVEVRGRPRTQAVKLFVENVARDAGGSNPKRQALS